MVLAEAYIAAAGLIEAHTRCQSSVRALEGYNTGILRGPRVQEGYRRGTGRVYAYRAVRINTPSGWINTPSGRVIRGTAYRAQSGLKALP